MLDHYSIWGKDCQGIFLKKLLFIFLDWQWGFFLIFCACQAEQNMVYFWQEDGGKYEFSI
jgi:hypothetical protein